MQKVVTYQSPSGADIDLTPAQNSATRAHFHYIACVGTDGTRPVVWGVGKGISLEDATNEAQEDASNWLDDAAEPENASIEYLQITQAQYLAIIAGDINAEGL